MSEASNAVVEKIAKPRPHVAPTVISSSAPAVAEHRPQRDVVTADTGKIADVAVGPTRVGPAA